MRILLLDGCKLNAWFLANLAPAGVRIQLIESFDEAVSALESSPVDAAIFNITPANLPWEHLARLCCAHQPPIPFIWSSPLIEDDLVAGNPTAPDAIFCPKPTSVAETRRVLEELVARADHRRREAAVEPSPSNRPLVRVV